MKRVLLLLVACAVIGAGLFFVVTRPTGLPDSVAAGHEADVANGALVFAAAGCSSCHAAPEGTDKTVLAGGHGLESAFGTFYAPNISGSVEGIGGWSLPEFARALRAGVSPDGAYYYPAFPYTSYAQMTDTDVADLFAYLGTLPDDPTPSRAHDVSFPFTLRRGIALWNMRYLDPSPVLTGALAPQVERGRYLVEVLGHCAECHTARDFAGGLVRSDWMQGAPNPSGKGRIPAIHPDKLDWSEGDIVEYLTSGFTPEYDSVGGSMAAVVANMALLTAEDRSAIAAYLKALP